jgi:AraC-like DNA-binding protein
MSLQITATRIFAADGIDKARCYALLYAERGEASLCVGDAVLPLCEKGVALLSPSDVPRIRAQSDLCAVLLCIPAALAAVPVLSPLFVHFAHGARTEVLDAKKAAFFDTVMGDILKITPETPFAAQQMLARTIDLLTALSPSGEPPQERAQGRITAAVLAYIEENISRAISLDDIAAALFISKYHMSHVFKAENGISVGEAVLRRKVAHAEALLASGLPAHRVCEMVGFHHYSAFFRIFKRITGHAPTGER